MSAPPSSSALDALSKALLKQLASSHDAHERARAVRKVGTWMRSRPSLTLDHLLKIMHGVFYCFFMSDKVPVQQELANSLADLQLAPLQADRSLLLFRAFLLTMQRQWTSIDQLRMDKFMTLVRRFVHRAFVVAARTGWQAAHVEQLADVLLDVLKHDTPARGLFMHVVDVFLTEMERAQEDDGAGKDATPMPFEAAHTLLTPFLHVLLLCGDRSMVERVEREVFRKIIDMCAQQEALAAQQQKKAQKEEKEEEEEEQDQDMEEDEEEEEEEEEAVEFPHLGPLFASHADALASTAFQLGALPDTPNAPAILSRSRKSLNKLGAELLATLEQVDLGDAEEDDARAEEERAERALAAQRAASAKAMKKQAAKRKAEAALEGDEEAEGEEDLAALKQAKAKKRNKKQRLADKRRKIAAILGAEPGQGQPQTQKRQQPAAQEQDEEDAGSDDEGLAMDGDEEAMLDDAEMDGEGEFDGEEDDEEGGAEEEAEEEEVPQLAPKLSAKEAARLERALAQAADAKKAKEKAAKGKKKIAPVHEQADEKKEAPVAPPAAVAAVAPASPSHSPVTPPKAGRKSPTASPVLAAAPAPAAVPAAAFHTPQPARKTVSHAAAAGAGAAATTVKPILSTAQAPPSSSKKNVQIVLARNHVRLFKRWAPDSVTVDTPSLLAKPSPKSAIKPDSIAFFLQHNKNGKELAARQKALAMQLTEAAGEDDATTKKGRTPLASPRAKAADFF